MKYVLVVTVSLLGLIVFTVPSGGVSVSKQFLEEHATIPLQNNMKSNNENSPTEVNTEFIELVFSTDHPKRTNLEIKQVKANEQALYESDGRKKENSINERSYLLIDQRFKVPRLNQLHSGQRQAQKSYLGTKNYKTFVSNTETDSKFFSAFQNIPDLSKALTLKPYVDPNMKTDVHVSNYEKPKRVNYNPQKKNAIINELNNLKFKVQAANRAIGHQYQDKRMNNGIKDALLKTKGVVNDRLEYLELLKPPLIRTGVKTGNDRNDYIIRAGSTDDIDYDKISPPGYNYKTLGVIYPTLTTPRKTVKSHHYESRSFPKQQNFHASDMVWKLEEMNMNSESRLEDSVYRASEEDREVFDKYIQTKSSSKSTDEKRNVNQNTNSEQGKYQCLVPGCTADREYPPSNSHESKCKCDLNVEQYFKSDVNEIGEVGVTTVQYNSGQDIEDTITIV